MAFSIRTEVRMNTKLVSDIDNFRSKYLQYDYDTDISCLAPAFEIYSLEKNRFLLMRDCKYILFKNIWRMRPDYCSFDQYGSVIYWPIILFANNCQSIEDFKDYEKIFIPDFSSIMQVLRNKVPSDEVEILKEPEVSAFVAYLQRSPMDNNEIQKIISESTLAAMNPDVVVPVTNPTSSTNTLTIPVTPSIVSLKQFELPNVPTEPETSLLTVNGSDPYTYGSDYTIKNQNVVSWNPSDTTGVSTIDTTSGDTIAFTYTHDILNEYTYQVEITTIELTNMYIVLPYNPVNNSSIELYIQGFNIPQRYGYDYILKNNNVISWDNTDVRNSILYDSLIEGDSIFITFLYKYTGV